MDCCTHLASWKGVLLEVSVVCVMLVRKLVSCFRFGRASLSIANANIYTSSLGIE
jgi:hypothetical protein